MEGKGYYHHVGGSASIPGGSRRLGPHNGHHVTGSGTITTEFNGHHPPREPRKEENTLVRRSFRRSGDEWRADSRRFTERRGKKTVRFDGGTNVAGEQEDWSWEADRQGSQDSATKDSGIDTSSTFTSSEDSNRGDLPKQSQASSDGQKIIVHMILRKSAGPGSILGLKVAGGQLLDDGRIGAVIEKVKEGTPAAVDGQLRPGDEVIDWNGHCLQGKSSQEVANIIAESRDENQVELIVGKNHPDATNNSITCSNLPSATTTSMVPQRRIAAQAQWRQTHETMPILQQPHHRGLKKCILWELYDVRREKPSVLVTSPGSPDLHGQSRNRHPRYPTTIANVGGKLQVKLDFNPACNRLSVTVFRATELTPRSNGQPRNPYAKVYLLPDRNEMSKRRTKTLANTNDPKWNETFDYNIRKSELKRKWLEVSVWDFTIHEANDFLGEAILELNNLNEKSPWLWQNLVPHEERRPIGQYHEPYDDIAITPVDYHLSPPSTVSRLSDSDTSEYDITDCDIPRDQRRTADGASISSLGSSSR
ncbi:hypothetical protein KQX54_003099 [Cotesia glomerata]|uniref:Uncharacterized protein n=1 Tax=Cotesia glomerata TaxID=32391 RepID=A0AAV7HUF9_COTGL|nr:hypothetical protein KQX54_003099 [Cotesia glomerata]